MPHPVDSVLDVGFTFYNTILVPSVQYYYKRVLQHTRYDTAASSWLPVQLSYGKQHLVIINIVLDNYPSIFLRLWVSHGGP